MSLSNCSNCKYYCPPENFQDITCAIVPAYAGMWAKLESLDPYTLECLPITDCSNFEIHPDFAPITLDLTLTPRQWREIVVKSPFPELLEQLKSFLPFFSNQWFTVESSCLSDISYDYDHSLLKIRFKTSGQAYQYSNVSPAVFHQLINSDSIGRFFNDHIKDIYPTQLLDY